MKRGGLVRQSGPCLKLKPRKLKPFGTSRREMPRQFREVQRASPSILASQVHRTLCLPSHIFGMANNTLIQGVDRVCHWHIQPLHSVYLSSNDMNSSYGRLSQSRLSHMYLVLGRYELVGTYVANGVKQS